MYFGGDKEKNACDAIELRAGNKSKRLARISL
jgi:hypothetical protein